jgi:hypothetical protein
LNTGREKDRHALDEIAMRQKVSMISKPEITIPRLRNMEETPVIEIQILDIVLESDCSTSRQKFASNVVEKTVEVWHIRGSNR